MSEPFIEPIAVVVRGHDAAVYRRAAETLARMLPEQPPTPEILVLHELRGRKPKAVVHDYLYARGWFEPGADLEIERTAPKKTVAKGKGATSKAPKKPKKGGAPSQMKGRRPRNLSDN